jgi:benzoate membrane transport protein
MRELEATHDRRRLGLPRPFSRVIPPLTMALPVMIFCLAALSFPLTLARQLGVSSSTAASWIAVLYGIPGVLSFLLVWRYRQPLLVAWNISGTVLAATFLGHASYAELCGATIVAGGLVVALGALGLSERVARVVPTAIVMAMVAGAVLPYVAGMFTEAGTAPAVVGGAFIAYMVGRAWLPAKVPAVLLAVIVGFGVAGLTGSLNAAQVGWSRPAVRAVPPAFSWASIVAFAPVLTVLMSASSNLASIVYVRSQGYPVPPRVIDLVTGAGTIVGSWFGLAPICMASFLAAPTAGPEAGDHDVRHWSVYFSGAALLLIALFAGVASNLLKIVPLSLLLALAGLALIGVLGSTLRDALQGPLTLGPLVAFAVAVSHLSYLGFGALFWSLVLGVATSLVLERDQLRAMRSTGTETA